MKLGVTILIALTAKLGLANIDTTSCIKKPSGSDSVQVCLSIKGKDVSGDLAFKYEAIVKGVKYGLLSDSHPNIEANEIWMDGGFVKNCSDEAACRIKFFTEDWKDYSARSYSTEENKNRIKIACAQKQKSCNVKVQEAVNQLKKKNSPIFVFTHPEEVRGPFIFLPSQRRF